MVEWFWLAQRVEGWRNPAGSLSGFQSLEVCYRTTSALAMVQSGTDGVILTILAPKELRLV